MVSLVFDFQFVNLANLPITEKTVILRTLDIVIQDCTMFSTLNKPQRLCIAGPIVLAFWLVIYRFNDAMAQWLVTQGLHLSLDTAAGASIHFFIYDTIKILLLLVLMVYVIAFVRAGLNVEKVRTYLQGRHRSFGYAMAAGFGAITPFCSCSSVPLFIGFTVGGIPLGVTMAFLITSPIINEVAVVLLFGLLGWQTTLLYVAIGLSAGMIGGYIMDLLKADRWLQPFLIVAKSNPTLVGHPNTANTSLKLLDRHDFAWSEMTTILKRVWPWVIVGVGLGAILHGYVPADWLLEHLSENNLFSVPIAVLLGIPLYTNVTGIVPIMESLLTKGLPLGTTLAFCMSTVAASLPEMLMLKQVMQGKLILVFLSTLFVLFTLIGWLLNLLA